MSVAFLIAGVQKAGTTALDDYLRQQPQLQMASTKEVHFFDDESVDWSAPNYAAYHRFFEHAREGAIWGEATPIYIYWPQSLERIRRYRPDMKLILIFRDPVDRAWSHWKMEAGRGWETEPFSWCIRDGRRRVAENAAPAGSHRIHSYVERGFYGQQLERALSLFPREQLLLLRSEDLRRDPTAVVETTCDFLGVARPPASLPQRELNVGSPGGLDPSDAAYLRDLYAEDLAAFERLSGLDVSAWMASEGLPA